MNIYANAFRCSLKNDGSEFILTLIQESPQFSKGSEQPVLTHEDVGSFVMTPETARRIGDAISSVLSTKSEDDIPDAE